MTRQTKLVQYNLAKHKINGAETYQRRSHTITTWVKLIPTQPIKAFKAITLQNPKKRISSRSGFLPQCNLSCLEMVQGNIIFLPTFLLNAFTFARQTVMPVHKFGGRCLRVPFVQVVLPRNLFQNFS